jgi:hypothetical protein
MLSDGSTVSGTLHLIGLDGISDQCTRARHGLETVILSDGTEEVCEQTAVMVQVAEGVAQCDLGPGHCKSVRG